MITNPFDYQHPVFQDQREYTLKRVIFDTGDDTVEATATLTFRHRRSRKRRTFRFSGVHFTYGCGAFVELRGHLPVYVATLAGRGWEGPAEIEVGDDDPGGVWFWAEGVEEIPELDR